MINPIGAAINFAAKTVGYACVAGIGGISCLACGAPLLMGLAMVAANGLGFVGQLTVEERNRASAIQQTHQAAMLGVLAAVGATVLSICLSSALGTAAFYLAAILCAFSIGSVVGYCARTLGAAAGLS
ncbi:MAG: hypothetical protein ACOYKZ_07760 [Chlamydiia bacterium]